MSTNTGDVASASGSVARFLAAAMADGVVPFHGHYFQALGEAAADLGLDSGAASVAILRGVFDVARRVAKKGGIKVPRASKRRKTTLSFCGACLTWTKHVLGEDNAYHCASCEARG